MIIFYNKVDNKLNSVECYFSTYSDLIILASEMRKTQASGCMNRNHISGILILTATCTGCVTFLPIMAFDI